MKALEAQAKEGKINENASIRDRQSAIVNAPIEDVWKLLVEVDNWSKWNPEISKVKCDEVKEGAEFSWSIRNTHLNSSFQIIQEPTLITWVGKSKFIKVIFVWELEASDSQTIVTVEESVDGFVVPDRLGTKEVFRYKRDKIDLQIRKPDVAIGIDKNEKTIEVYDFKKKGWLHHRRHLKVKI